MQFDQGVVHRGYGPTRFRPNLKRDLRSVSSDPLPEGDLSCLLLRYAQELAENLKVRGLVLGDPEVLVLQRRPPSASSGKYVRPSLACGDLLVTPW